MEGGPPEFENCCDNRPGAVALLGNLWEGALSGGCMQAVELEPAARSDAELIAAIRAGDADLFRELVERHGPAVFGIAWSRLGNRALAEEAAQETFVKAYRALGLLRQTEKFGAWLAAMARHMAINFGIRHRRELAKRERWQLEQPSEATADPDVPPTPTPQTVQQTLAGLSAIHRETLVLYYIEGRSIAEAAAGLGISETAFKTRLHRARASMRAALEQRVESSLDRLRPSRQFAAGVMLSVQQQGATPLLGSAVLAGLGKLLPFGLLLAQMILSIYLARWIWRKDLENFREPDGFRARNLARVHQSATARLLLLLGILGLAQWLFPRSWINSALLAGLGLPIMVWNSRRLYLMRNRQAFWELMGTVLLAPILLLNFLDWPLHWKQWSVGLLMLGLAQSFRNLPLRMDYSLFLRAANGLLPFPSPMPSRNYTRAERFAFARWLAVRHLCIDWRWTGDALLLRLPPVTPTPRDGFLPMLWRGASTLSISPTGQVSAELAPASRQDLVALGHAEPFDPLTVQVASNAAAALAAHADQNTARAEALVGEQSETEVFHQPLNRTTSARWRLWSFRAFAALSIVTGCLVWRDYWSGNRQGLAPVSLDEAAVRTALEHTFTHRSEVLPFELGFSAVELPERRFFSDRALAGLEELLREQIAKYPATNDAVRATQALLQEDLLQRVFHAGIFTADEWAALGISISSIQQEVQGWPPEERASYLDATPGLIGRSPPESSAPPSYYRHTILRSARLNLRTWLLETCGLLQEFDTSSLVSTLAAHQILPSSPEDDRWRDVDAEALRGLFLLARQSPLADTADVLAILARLGQLHRIDREECIRGILRYHVGRGLFVAPSGPSSTWRVRGDARGAWSAVESLRLLGALDRVMDLSRWQFRTTRYTKHDPAESPWEIIEAYGLAQRFTTARETALP